MAKVVKAKAAPASPKVELIGTFFSIVGEEPLITILVSCEDEKWRELLQSPFGFVYNRFIKALGLVYEYDRTFVPGVMIDNIDTAKIMISWLTRTIAAKRYTIQYIRLGSNRAENVLATIPIDDTSVFENILSDLKEVVGGQK